MNELITSCAVLPRKKQVELAMKSLHHIRKESEREVKLGLDPLAEFLLNYSLRKLDSFEPLAESSLIGYLENLTQSCAQA